MKKETKLRKQLETTKEWARKARQTNETYFLGNMGLLYTQVAIEQIINYLDMQTNSLTTPGRQKGGRKTKI